MGSPANWTKQKEICELVERWRNLSILKHTEIKEKNTEENTKKDMDKKSKIQTGVPKSGREKQDRSKCLNK